MQYDIQFYVGLHQPSDAQHFERCCISINRIVDRRSSFLAGAVLLDSGAFTKVARDGGYVNGPEVYAAHVTHWADRINLVAAASEDLMCEQFVLERTGLDVATHQRLTIERYDAIQALAGHTTHIMPVLQGYQPSEYVAHIRQYGARLTPAMWVGVGSVCKRNGSPDATAAVLLAIKQERPDLRLHGFGLKTTALESDLIRSLLHSADSMAWSYAARREGRNANDWREAEAFTRRITAQRVKQHAYQHTWIEGY